MKFKEVIGRITGFSVPIFGVSWNPPQPDVTAARRVLAFLEDRRVLYNPYNIEGEDQCIYSVTEIRKFLTEIIGNLGDKSELSGHLRAIRTACRVFLDAVGPRGDQGHFKMPRWDERYGSPFFTALGELRATIGIHVAAIAVMHGLDVEGELASIMPAVEERTNDGQVG
jgi:hypothetical protein